MAIKKTLLNNWNAMNAELSSLKEADIQKLIDWELSDKRRRVIVERLHARLSKLRVARERAVLLKKCK